MPVVRIDAPSALPENRLKALADAVHSGLVTAMNVPPSDRFQIINRHDAATLLIDPAYPGVSRTAEAVIVAIALRAGRTDEQKRAFYKAVVAQAERVGGFKPDDILIALSENTLIDWSFGRGEVFPPPGN
jgi:phenylpyruvate tautomerase PptA (4-oxalocrotonate tautomerase family)